MTSETEEIKPTPPPPEKKKLSLEERRAIWAKDEYAGQSGTFICDPFTGKRTLQKD